MSSKLRDDQELETKARLSSKLTGSQLLRGEGDGVTTPVSLSYPFTQMFPFSTPNDDLCHGLLGLVSHLCHGLLVISSHVGWEAGGGGIGFGAMTVKRKKVVGL